MGKITQNEQVMINGRLCSREEAMVSVYDHGLLYGDGVYATLRTYHGKVFLGDIYVKRLFAQAKKLGIKIGVTQNRLLKWIEEAVLVNGFVESRIRVTVTRGDGKIGHGNASKGNVIIMVHSLVEGDLSLYEKGVRVVTVRARRVLPDVKSLSQITSVLAKNVARKRKAYDALLVDEKGYVCETTIANVFFVHHDTLYTPSDKILKGVTRGVVLKLAKSNGLKVREMDLTLKQMFRADECFLTNTTKGIIPVIKINNRKIGKGNVGVKTHTLMRAFRSFVGEKL